jgi:alpha-amylase
MTLVSLYFFAHQPFRLRPYEQRTGVTNVPQEQLEDYYFEDSLNKEVFLKVAEKCYFPATTMMRDAVKRYKDTEKPFRLSYGLSGTFLEQAKRYAPSLLDLYKEMADTGLVEFCGETYYHSLSSLFDAEKEDFKIQVKKHSDLIFELFGQRPSVFRNTEMLFNDGIASAVKSLGYKGIITEGVDWLMQGWRSPDFVYSSPSGLPILLRNYRLSDDIGYRFPNENWSSYPLRAETFAGWLAGNTDPSVLLAMDYEAVGEHIWAEKGIFDFLWNLPEQVSQFPQLEWSTPSDIISRVPVTGGISVDDFQTISWADQERDTSAWLHSEMQLFCFEEMKRMEEAVIKTGNSYYIDVWRKMQTSDHLYYLSDKSLSDGDVHKYFSAYGSLVESFTRLHTALYDLRRRAENYPE